MATKVTNVVLVDHDHQVLRVEGGDRKFMKKPCPDCPWKRSSVGIFPSEAFRVSAHTSYDMNESSFGCHSAGTENPKTCAGFLLKGAAHNLGVRLRQMTGNYDLSEVSDGGHELFNNYREMAVANGVDPEDKVLKACRDDTEW